jgi:predicted DNA-binding transcriptional regulator AlpA
MTAVVHSLHERQALDWAIQFFRDFAHQLTAEGSKKKFHDTFTRVLLDAHYVYDYTREERGEIYTQLVDEALDEARHGNPLAVQQLSKFAAALIEKGEPLPEEIRGAVAELLRNPPKVKNKRGPGPFTLMARDSAIIEALTHINETIWRLEREGKFPKRVPLGANRHGWVDTEIDDWLVARAASRNEAA